MPNIDSTPELLAHYEKSAAHLRELIVFASQHGLAPGHVVALRQHLEFDERAIAQIHAGTLKATKHG